MKKLLSIVCAIAILFSAGIVVSEMNGTDRPAPEVIEGVKYISDYLTNASALYVAGEKVTVDNAYFYNAGYATDADVTLRSPTSTVSLL